MTHRWSLLPIATLLAFGIACEGDMNTDGEDMAGGGGADLSAPREDAGSREDAGPRDMTTAPPGDMATPTADASDGGGVDAAEMGAPEPVPIFVAQGAVGRTIISCDDGRSWVADSSFDRVGDPLVCGKTDPVRCYDDSSGCSFMQGDVCETRDTNCDCDHHPGSGTGITYGDGWFVATFGWGPAGEVRRSQDGITWETVLEGTTFARVAFGGGAFVTGARRPMISRDAGANWEQGPLADLQSPAGETVHNARNMSFVDVMGGRFVLTGQSGEKRDVLVSADGAASWARPDPLPGGCADGVQGIAGGGGLIVIGTRDGEVCVSGDGGLSFVSHDIGAQLATELHYDGQRFVGWTRDRRRATSADGTRWTLEDISPALDIGATGWNPETGTFVAVRGGWKRWYDEQEFYRSADGLTWERLDPSSFTASHRIQHIAFGYAPPGTACPSVD